MRRRNAAGLNNQLELDFLQQGLRGIVDVRRAFVLGSTNGAHRRTIDLNSYIIDDTGIVLSYLGIIKKTLCKDV